MEGGRERRNDIITYNSKVERKKERIKRARGRWDKNAKFQTGKMSVFKCLI